MGLESLQPSQHRALEQSLGQNLSADPTEKAFQFLLFGFILPQAKSWSMDLAKTQTEALHSASLDSLLGIVAAPLFEIFKAYCPAPNDLPEAGLIQDTTLGRISEASMSYDNFYRLAHDLCLHDLPLTTSELVRVFYDSCHCPVRYLPQIDPRLCGLKTEPRSKFSSLPIQLKHHPEMPTSVSRPARLRPGYASRFAAVSKQRSVANNGAMTASGGKDKCVLARTSLSVPNGFSGQLRPTDNLSTSIDFGVTVVVTSDIAQRSLHAYLRRFPRNRISFPRFLSALCRSMLTAFQDIGAPVSNKLKAFFRHVSRALVRLKVNLV